MNIPARGATVSEYFCHHCQQDTTLAEKKFAPEEQFLPFKNRPLLQRGLMYREANIYISKMAENQLSLVIPIQCLNKA